MKAEPAFSARHRPRPTGVLLCNLGTPDAPTPAGAAPLPGAVPVRPARRRDPARGLVADPARHHPAHAAGALGAQVRADLDARGLAAGGLDREAGQLLLAATSGSAAPRRRCGSAMRYGSPAIAAVLDALSADGATRVLVLPLYPQYSAADHRQRHRRRRRLGAAHPPRCPSCASSTTTTTTPATSRRWPSGSRDHWAARRAAADKLVLSFHGMPQAHACCCGDPYHCECLKTGAAARPSGSASAPTRLARHVPEPLRQAPSGCSPTPSRRWSSWPRAGVERRRRDVPGLQRRLPGDARGDRRSRRAPPSCRPAARPSTTSRA